MAHISTSSLIKDSLNDHDDKWFYNRMVENLQSGDIINDEFINTLMKKRLSKVDCQTMGFCLEGYPKTESQNKYLKEKIKIQPDIVFVLDCPDHIIMQRLQRYKFDPVTGRMYSEGEIKKLNSTSLLNRLTDLPDETESSIKTR